MNKIFWVLCCFVLYTVSLRAQSQCELRLYGSIIDEHDGSMLAYANVILKDSKNKVYGTSSDLNGKYEIGKLCPDAYTVIISHIGCQADTLMLDLKSSARIDFSLEHHWEELGQIEVLETASNQYEESLSKNSVDRNKGEGMAEMIKAIPGVQTFKTGSNVSKPMIGGFTSNRVQIVNQGVQHVNQNWGDEHAPEIDPFAYVNYKVVKGASALKYGGGAIGGIVLLEPKPLKHSPGIGGLVNGVYASNNRMYASSLLLEGNHGFLPQFSWRAQASYKRSGNIKSPDYYQDNTGMEESNLSYALEWMESNWRAQLFYSLNNSTIGIFSGAHLGNLSDLEKILESGEPKEIDTEGFSYEINRPFQLITHELLSASVNRYFENSHLEIKMNRQFNIREEFDKELPRNNELAALDIPEFSLSLESYSLNATYVFDRGDFQWDLGGGFLTKDNTVNSFIDFIPDYKSEQIHFFGVGEWEKDAWTIEAAARVDQIGMDVNKFVQSSYLYSRHEYLAMSANLGINRSLSEFNTVSLNLNYSERAPAINELYSDGLHHGTASLEYGDASLNKERAKSIRANWKLNKGPFKVNVDAYLQWISDFIYLEPDGIDLSVRGAFPLYRWKNTEAFLRGIDLLLSYEFSECWRLSQKSSILLANQGNQYLVNMPANRIEHTLDYQINQLKINIYLSHLYVAKQDRYDEAVELVVPPDAYQLVTIGAMKDFNIKDKIDAKLGLRVNNLLDIAYRDYLNRFRYYADEMGREVRITFELKF